MRHYEIVKVDERQLTKLKCDICGMDITASGDMELQEVVIITGFGGYSSVFGDGCEYQLDMCQHCFKEKLGQYVRVF